MKVKELKQILVKVPDDAEIILAAVGHYNFCDTESHGDAQLSLIEIEGEYILVFSADDCGFDAAKLNLAGLTNPDGSYKWYGDNRIIHKIKR